MSLAIRRTLIARRKSLHMSQRALGKKLFHTEVGQVSRWERGDVNPHMKSLVEWADALGCEVIVKTKETP